MDAFANPRTSHMPAYEMASTTGSGYSEKTDIPRDDWHEAKGANRSLGVHRRRARGGRCQTHSCSYYFLKWRDEDARDTAASPRCQPVYMRVSFTLVQIWVLRESLL